MRSLLVFITLAAQAFAQAPRPHVSAAQAQQLEAALKGNPNDKAARKALLNYYFVDTALKPAEAIAARRRHILWVIGNAPGDDMAGGPEATIDAAGHYLADPEGFKLASAAWRAQAAKPDIGVPALMNAANFFKLSDKEFTIKLLERAVSLEPANKNVAAAIGTEYAWAIMGVTMVNRNGYPMASDASQTQSAAARRARAVLTTSRNPYLLAQAGYSLLWQGAVLHYSRKLAFDTDALAKGALDRAVSLAPNDRDVALYRKQYDEMHREYERVRKAAAPQVAQEPVAQAAAPAAPARPEVTADDLKKVAAGMRREDLLKIGEPAGRMTLDEDGHLIEIYQYSAKGAQIGTVRMTDGVVSSVKLP